MASSKIDSDPATLTRYILTSQQKYPEATGDLTIILNAIQTACKSITAAVRRAGLQGLYGLQGSSNVSGDEQKKLDVISDEIFCNMLKATGRVAVMVTEEQDEAVLVEAANAKYVAVFDPLDGSSNIDCNVSVGSIFGIYRRPAECIGKPPSAAESLQPGSALICAGYSCYGSSTQLVVVFQDDVVEKRGVNIFTLDPTVGEFILSHGHVKIPEKCQKIYSCNEGNIDSFPAYVREFVAQAKKGEKPYSLRYVGSMVADVHRTLLYGGCFIYPSTAAAPSGKLRLLYECNPMAAIMEAAGGRAITGTSEGRILDILPTKLHERRPILLGCARDIDILEKLMKETPQ